MLYIALDGKPLSFIPSYAVIRLLESYRLCFTGEAFNYCAILDDYEMHDKLGEGGFGAVYLATNKLNKKQFAIKFMDMS